MSKISIHLGWLFTLLTITILGVVLYDSWNVGATTGEQVQVGIGFLVVGFFIYRFFKVERDDAIPSAKKSFSKPK